MNEFEFVSEVYGLLCMFMVCVEDKEFFDVVIGGFKCDYLEEVLVFVRAVRSINGGKGYSDEIVNVFCMLLYVNFKL